MHLQTDVLIVHNLYNTTCVWNDLNTRKFISLPFHVHMAKWKKLLPTWLQSCLQEEMWFAYCPVRWHLKMHDWICVFFSRSLYLVANWLLVIFPRRFHPGRNKTLIEDPKMKLFLCLRPGLLTLLLQKAKVNIIFYGGSRPRLEKVGVEWVQNPPKRWNSCSGIWSLRNYTFRFGKSKWSAAYTHRTVLYGCLLTQGKDCQNPAVGRRM